MEGATNTAKGSHSARSDHGKELDRSIVPSKGYLRSVLSTSNVVQRLHSYINAGRDALQRTPNTHALDHRMAIFGFRSFSSGFLFSFAGFVLLAIVAAGVKRFYTRRRLEGARTDVRHLADLSQASQGQHYNPSPSPRIHLCTHRRLYTQ